MKTTKKFLSLLLAVLLISTCFAPAAVFADSGNMDTCDHNWVFTVTQLADGCISGRGYYECSVCSLREYAEIPGSEHNWEWVIDDYATPFQTGRKHQVCTYCGAVQNINTKVPLDKSSGGFGDAIARFFTGIIAMFKNVFEQVADNFSRLFKK
ncbi:MAG: hypothetical protein J1E34_00110 [Oscillospiraceae bacterium]|nr:hypothetical protein [Oscillospiraceae bacterium]